MSIERDGKPARDHNDWPAYRYHGDRAFLDYLMDAPHTSGVQGPGWFNLRPTDLVAVRAWVRTQDLPEENRARLADLVDRLEADPTLELAFSF